MYFDDLVNGLVTSLRLNRREVVVSLLAAPESCLLADERGTETWRIHCWERGG